MLKHVVMWKLKDYALNATRAENALRIKIELEALREIIPEIRKLEVGINIIPSEQAADAALYSEFEDRTALQVYLDHPEHQEAAQWIKDVVTERRVVDYIID